MGVCRAIGTHDKCYKLRLICIEKYIHSKIEISEGLM
jgi:hypothetical protein